MKKAFLLLLLMGLTCGLSAGPVSPEKALDVARRVFSADPATKAVKGEPKIIWDGEFEPTKAGTDPAFYVVARDGGGFVIVAGDDAVRPVLALSYESPFKVEGMPDHLRYWMNSIKRYVRLASVAKPDTLEDWNEYGVLPEAGLTDEYLGSRTMPWGQYDPGNLLAPIIPGESSRPPCGCVPLAFAEIMAWFKYPVQGNGTVPGYTNRTGNYPIPAHELGTVYDWDSFAELTTPQAYTDSDGTEVGDNLAQLLYDVGTLLQVYYSESATVGDVFEMARSLAPKMGYSKSAVERRYVWGYPLWQWNQMLREEVSRHPVYYAGYDWEQGEENGHAWVLDGFATYNGEMVFHFNLGWYGWCNGYYYSNYLFVEYPSPDYKDTDFYFPYYFSSVSAVFGFEPDPSQTSDYVYGLSFHDVHGEVNYPIPERGIHYTRDDTRVSASAYLVINAGNVPFTGILQYFRVDKNGERNPAPASAAYSDSFAVSTYKEKITLDFDMDGAVLGDRYVAFYQAYEEAPYEPVFIAEPSSVLTEIPAFPAAFIKTEASYNTGDYFSFRLVNQDYTYRDAVWKITSPSGETATYEQAEDRVQLTRAGTYKIKVDTGKETIVTTITVN